MTTWAIFQDFRGVLLCERVNLNMDIWEKEIPARPAIKRWGKVVRAAQPAETRQHVVFDVKRYSRADYVSSAFDPAPDGYTFKPNRRYMEDNYWGPVDVICFITSDKVGQRVHKMLAKLSPEGHDDVKRRDNDAVPLVDTDQLIEDILKIIDEGNR